MLIKDKPINKIIPEIKDSLKEFPEYYKNLVEFDFNVAAEIYRRHFNPTPDETPAPYSAVLTINAILYDLVFSYFCGDLISIPYVIKDTVLQAEAAEQTGTYLENYLVNLYKRLGFLQISPP